MKSALLRHGTPTKKIGMEAMKAKMSTTTKNMKEEEWSEDEASWTGAGWKEDEEGAEDEYI